MFLEFCTPHLLIEVLTSISGASSCPQDRVVAATTLLTCLRDVTKEDDGHQELRRSVVNVTRTHVFSKK